jgi:hypothetical protein
MTKMCLKGIKVLVAPYFTLTPSSHSSHFTRYASSFRLHIITNDS